MCGSLSSNTDSAMKKLIFVLAVMVMAAMFSACSVAVPVLHGIVPEKIEGVIYTTDGNEYQGQLYAPNALTKKLTLTTNDDQKITVAAKDVAELIIWHEKRPDDKHVLLYQPYWIKKKQKRAQWMALHESGKYLDIYASSDFYIPFSDGVLQVRSVKGGSITMLVKKKEADYPMQFSITDMSKRAVRKNLLDYLSDDPVFCKKLTDLEIEPDEYKTIAIEYNPNR